MVYMIKSARQKARQRVFTWREIRELEGFWASDEEERSFWPRRYNYDDYVRRHDTFRYKLCGVCGRAIVVNNYPDRLGRTPQVRGLVYCGLCNPANIVPRRRIYKLTERRRMTRLNKIAEILSRRACLKGVSKKKQKKCKCLPCVVRRLPKQTKSEADLTFKTALVVKVLAKHGCLKKSTSDNCKCIGCAARKLFPEDGSFGYL